MSDEAVWKTDPTTPGLLNIMSKEHLKLSVTTIGVLTKSCRITVKTVL